MGYPSGYFASTSAGQVLATFSGTFSSTAGGGYPYGGGGYSDILITCQIRNAAGTVVAQGTLSRNAQSLTLTADYPGGNQSWQVVMSYLSHNIAGVGSVFFQPLRINVRMAKR